MKQAEHSVDFAGAEARTAWALADLGKRFMGEVSGTAMSAERISDRLWMRRARWLF
jgi:hypothetical protein